jgi:polysaccharide biosynthesis/export protein
MKTARLRIYFYKCIVLGLIPVVAIVSSPIVSLAESVATRSVKVKQNQLKIAKAKSAPRPVGRSPFDSYTLGAGDRLRLDLFNVPEYSGEFLILADGTINLPVVGAIPLQGRSLQSASQVITYAYSRYVKRPVVTLSLISPRPVQVAIAGEISRAGSYTVPFTAENRKFPSVSQVIQLAGGTSQTADLRNVKVRRFATGRIYTINLFDVLQRGNTSQDVSLRDGDTVFIPRSASVNAADLMRLSGSNLATQDTTVKIAVVGEVGKPGTYTMKGENNSISTVPGASSRISLPTLTEAIKLAGGSTASADITKIRVRRNTRTGSGQTLSINLMALFKNGDFSQDILLQDGDTIFIPTGQTINNADTATIAASNIGPQSLAPVKVVVVGEVNRPGTFTVRGDANTTNNNTQISGNVTLPTVTQAIQAASGIKPTANIRQIQLRRTTRTGEQLITLDLFKLIEQGDTSQDIILQEGDRISVPYAQSISPKDVETLSSSTLSPAAIRINVVGELGVGKNNISTIEVPPNTTLNQAILIAGGFNNARANKNQVEFIRLNPNGTVTKRTVRLDFAKGIDNDINPRLQNQDTIVIGRSNLTRIGDGLNTIFQPFQGLFNLFGIFR